MEMEPGLYLAAAVLALLPAALCFRAGKRADAFGAVGLFLLFGVAAKIGYELVGYGLSLLDCMAQMLPFLFLFYTISVLSKRKWVAPLLALFYLLLFGSLLSLFGYFSFLVLLILWLGFYLLCFIGGVFLLAVRFIRARQKENR